MTLRSWYCKPLGDALLAAPLLADIEERFRAEFRRAGAPDDMALFVSYRTQAHLHCEVTVFFSPAAEDVARAVSAVPCGPPPRSGLELRVGAEGCRDLLL